VGRPLPEVEFRVVESPASPDSSIGALQIRYPYGFEGYVDLHGVALHPEGAFDGDWFCSSDLARSGPGGTLEVLGRSDLSVNRNGLLLTFADLEAALREIDGVEAVGVAAGPDGIRGRVLVAFCALGRGSEQSAAQLRAKLANRVPAFAMPEQIRVVPELPRLPNGKINRSQLAAWAQSDARSHTAGAVPIDTPAQPAPHAP
jgi:acyl-coenzyme A synthetase/AMP-(fatty) acid ligase